MKKFLTVMTVLIVMFAFNATIISNATVTTQSTTTQKRVATGKGKTLSFKKGAKVLGWRIIMNGKTYYNSYCTKTRYSGKVTDGVINYWTSELVKGMKKIN
ncbi:MAG: hypothetical protein WCG91_04050 [Candidatus Shapirobacteria bacterium]